MTLLFIQLHNRYSGVFVLKSTWSDGISPCYRSFWKFFLLKSWPFGSFLWDPDRKYSLTAFHLPWLTLCSPHSKFFSERSKFRTSGKSQKIEIVSFPFQLVSGEEVCFITNYLETTSGFRDILKWMKVSSQKRQAVHSWLTKTWSCVLPRRTMLKFHHYHIQPSSSQLLSFWLVLCIIIRIYNDLVIGS